ncbi:hypothetical protein AeMF1_005033 [Aphanomyces euteiches]|nr:hypothetical protein AeMF1_005033 [Aphanomyces euteiches]KAH9183438.1 hypothetical protein AeNC1_014586 [Aphanomyces euteiches]
MTDATDDGELLGRREVEKHDESWLGLGLQLFWCSIVPTVGQSRTLSCWTPKDTLSDAPFGHLLATIQPSIDRLPPRSLLFVACPLPPFALTVPEKSTRTMSDALLSCAICYDASSTTMIECPSCTTAFCHECLQTYVELAIQEGRVRRLQCPSCPVVFTPDMILDLVSPEMFARYVELKAKVCTGRVCPRCGERVTSTGRKIHCDACNISSCGDCGEAYHLFGCQDRSFKAWKRCEKERDVRACPNCRADIEKQGGCTHMTCAHCEFEFCWLCRVEWSRHADAMCKPRAFFESESSALGPNAPIRAVTKSVVAVAALAVAAVGVGVAAVVAPSLFLFDGAKGVLRRQKQNQSIKKWKKLHMKTNA